MRWVVKEDYMNVEGCIDFIKFVVFVYYECQFCGGKLDVLLVMQKIRN